MFVETALARRGLGDGILEFKAVSFFDRLTELINFFWLSMSNWCKTIEVLGEFSSFGARTRLFITGELMVLSCEGIMSVKVYICSLF